MVTSLELKECLEQMAKLLNTKIEDATSSTRTIVKSDPLRVQKIELQANDIKLEGTKNYLRWSRRAILLLKAKGLQRFVEPGCKEPSDKKGDEWKIWDATNSVVVVWLLTSMDMSVLGQLETLSTAVEVWNTVETMYSGAVSVMRTWETEEKIDALSQWGKTVQQYAAELKHLWTDLDHYSPLTLEGSANIQAGKKYLEQRRIFKFLKGLNSQFEQRRANMCHLPAFSSLDEVIAAMEQEEIRLKVLAVGDSTVSRSALAVLNNNSRGSNNSRDSPTDDKECYNCGQRGHLSWDCSPRSNGWR